MKKIISLILALVATTCLWAYDFQSGDLYYNITSDTTVEVTYQYQWSSDNYAGLTTATIPSTVTYNGTTYSVTSIGDEAFSGCSSLTSVTIPESVTSIGDDAFWGCSSFTTTYYTGTIAQWCNIDFGGYFANPGGDLYINDLLIADLIIPDSIIAIKNYTFFKCSSLTSVTIPNNITNIGDYAFLGCSSLSSIVISTSVTSIGREAFCNCDAMISIFIPSSIASVGYGAFANCDILESIVVSSTNRTYDSREYCNAIVETATNTLVSGCKNTIIPNSITRIGDAAFSCCNNLTSITIPNSVTSIGRQAFYGCSSLTSFTIPFSVEKIGVDAFYNCSSLKSTYYTGTIDQWCNINFDSYNSNPNCSSENLYINNQLQINLVIPNSITAIKNYAFGGCSSITSITIPNSITRIGDAAFYSCSSLTSVTIPNSVASIGEWAFAFCSNLKTVICEAIEVPELGDYVFYYMPLAEATLYVPAQSLDDYKAAEQWNEFGTILPIEGESEEEIELQDTEMTIVFTNSEDNDSEIYRQTISIKVPTAPTIAGFTFLYWQPVAEPITNEITIQAIYEADTPTSAEVYVNPANPAQKLLRNGQVYILQDGKTYTITGQRF